MSLHDVAPRLAVARDTRRLEVALGTGTQTAFLAAADHRTRPCACGGLLDVYRMEAVRPIGVVSMDGAFEHAGQVLAVGKARRCRTCGEGAWEGEWHERAADALERAWLRTHNRIEQPMPERFLHRLERVTIHRGWRP